MKNYYNNTAVAVRLSGGGGARIMPFGINVPPAARGARAGADKSAPPLLYVLPFLALRHEKLSQQHG